MDDTESSIPDFISHSGKDIFSELSAVLCQYHEGETFAGCLTRKMHCGLEVCSPMRDAAV